MWKKQQKIIKTHAKKDPTVLTHVQEDSLTEKNIDPRFISSMQESLKHGSANPNASLFMQLSPTNNSVNKSVFASLKVPKEVNQTLAGVNPSEAASSSKPINQ